MTAVSETILANFFPKNFPPPIAQAASLLLGFPEVDATYVALQNLGREQPIAKRLLEFLRVTYRVAPEDLERVPRTGAAVVVANHPFGLLEPAVLVTALRRIRPDVRLVTNELLNCIPELRELMIPVDVSRGDDRANLAGVRGAAEYLAGGGLLIVFPAGAVSHFHWRERASVDPPWQAAVARMIALAAEALEAREAKAPVVVPIFVPGQNGFGFHAAGLVHPHLRTALLARELLNKKGAEVELRIGSPIAWEKLAAMATHEERIQYLRWRTYVLANRRAFKPDMLTVHKRVPKARPIIGAVPPERMAAEIAALPEGAMLDATGDLKVYLAEAEAIPETLREIGRLRETTFRLAGEGSGRAVDLDEFDQQYLHLFVWQAAKQEVVAAYRLQAWDRARSLYTQTLFHFDRRFFATLGPAVELGRSFVRTEYQKGFAPLLLLWKGIGKFIAANPRYKTLFGPVSISNEYQTASRDLMIAFLEKRASISEWVGLVKARRAHARPRTEVPLNDVEELSDVIRDIEAAPAGIPVLLRQYLKLGGKLLAFNVDHSFSKALDGLIVVDLTKTEPKLVERYLGKAEAQAFLSYHKETPHGTQ